MRSLYHIHQSVVMHLDTFGNVVLYSKTILRSSDFREKGFHFSKLICVHAWI